MSESIFNPNTPGPMSIIIGNHFDDPKYLMQRSQEMINEAVHFFSMAQIEITRDRLTKVLGLLASVKCLLPIQESNTSTTSA